MPLRIQHSSKNSGRHQEIKQGFLLAAQFISFSARSEYPGNVEPDLPFKGKSQRLKSQLLCTSLFL